MARHRGSHDLLVLDVMLPGRNGYRLCAELRSADDWTPVLLLTAKDGDLDEAEALDTGADDYLTKPFSFPVLAARVRALLRRTPAASRPRCRWATCASTPPSGASGSASSSGC